MIRKKSLLRYYPVAVRLLNRHVVVAGGGKVAERKVKALYGCGAKVCVVSPTATPALKHLVEGGKISWARRGICRSDIEGAYLVVAATDDNDINEKVSRWAQERRIWVNVVDNASLSDYISPAVMRTRDYIVTAYTDAKDPALSRDLKNFLKEKWDVFLRYRDRL